MLVKNILVILHVITAAGWFGLAMILGAVSRKSLAETTVGLREIGTKAERLMLIFIVLTFVFGLTAFFVGGGFAAYSPLYHSSITLVLILVLIQLFMIRPAWKVIASGGEGAASSRKRLAMGTGIGHLLWLVVLILMFWNHFPLYVQGG